MLQLECGAEAHRIKTGVGHGALGAKQTPQGHHRYPALQANVRDWTDGVCVLGCTSRCVFGERGEHAHLRSCGVGEKKQ